MSYKTISLRDEVYRRLRDAKRGNESFSDVILRLLDAEQPPLKKHVQAWQPLRPEDLRAVRERIEQLRHETPAR